MLARIRRWLLGQPSPDIGEDDMRESKRELAAAHREAEEARRRAAIVMDQVRRQHQHWLERALVPPRDAHHGQGPTP